METKSFLDEYYDRDRPKDIVKLWTAHGSVRQCVETLKGYIDAGFDHITLRMTARDQARQFEIYVKEVLPELGIR